MTGPGPGERRDPPLWRPGRGGRHGAGPRPAGTGDPGRRTGPDGRRRRGTGGGRRTGRGQDRGACGANCFCDSGGQWRPPPALRMRRAGGHRPRHSHPALLPDRRHQAWSGQLPEPSFTRNVPVDRGFEGRNPLSRERTHTLRARCGAGGSRCTGINQRVPVDGIEKENRRTMRKLRRLGVGSGAALLAAALIAPAGVAHADTHTVTDQYGASASSQVVDLHLLGRHVSFGAADVTSTLDAVTKQVAAEAKGLGTLLVPASQAIARFNDPASVNKACALPQVEAITGLLSGTTQGLNLPVRRQPRSAAVACRSVACCPSSTSTSAAPRPTSAATLTRSSPSPSVVCCRSTWLCPRSSATSPARSVRPSTA